MIRYVIGRGQTTRQHHWSPPKHRRAQAPAEPVRLRLKLRARRPQRGRNTCVPRDPPVQRQQHSPSAGFGRHKWNLRLPADP